MADAKNKNRIVIFLTDKTLDNLNEVAEKKEISRSSMTSQILAEHFNS